MTADFQPGDVIERRHLHDGRVLAHWTVLDPVRTKRGKLRMRGPRGGYHTAWWSPEEMPGHYSSTSKIYLAGSLE